MSNTTTNVIITSKIAPADILDLDGTFAGFRQVESDDNRARNSRRRKLVSLHHSLNAKKFQAKELVARIKVERDENGKPVPEDFNYTSEKAVSYANVLGELFTLPGTGDDDLPASVDISTMHRVFGSAAGKVKGSDAQKIIREKGQTVATAWEDILMLAASSRVEKSVADMLKAAMAVYGKAVSLCIDDPSLVTDDVKAIFGTFVAMAGDVQKAASPVAVPAQRMSIVA